MQPGDTVGRYEVVKLVGRGGMGEVYLGHDPALGRSVVIKLAHSEGAAGPDRNRLRREAQIHGRLLHENIVRVYDLVTVQDRDHIISEYVDGGTLREHLERTRRSDLGGCLRLSLEVARGLAHAHDHQVVHRDLKLDNVMVTDSGMAKITDFGLSRSDVALPDFESSQASAGGIVGTLLTMSPEQTVAEPADHRSDVFALGVLYYELFCNELPFAGRDTFTIVENIRNKPHRPLLEKRADVPIGMSRLVDGMLEKRRVDRPSSREVVENLERLVQDHRQATGAVVRVDQRSAAVMVLRAQIAARANGATAATTLDFQRTVRSHLRRIEGTLLIGTGQVAAFCVGTPRVHERPVQEALRVADGIRVELASREVPLHFCASVALGDIDVHAVPGAPIITGAVIDQALAMSAKAPPQSLVAGPGAQRRLTTSGYALKQTGVSEDLRAIGGLLVESTNAVDVDQTPAVGREQVIQSVRAEAQKVFGSDGSTARGRVVVVAGEAGIGKSIVVRTLTREVLPGTPRVLAIGASENTEYVPFGVFVPLLRDFVGTEDQQPWPAEVRGAIAKAMPEDPVGQAAIAQVLQVASSDQQAVLSREQQRAGPGLIAECVAEFILAQFEVMPTLLVIEDLHWSDTSSDEVVRTLVRNAERVPALLLLTHRPDYEPQWPAGSAAVLELARLPPRDARTLVNKLCEQSALAPEIVDAIISRGEGVPLWLEELTFAALELDGNDPDGPRKLQAPTLRNLVQQRLQRLSKTTVRVARLCAAIGRRAPVQLLVEASGLDEASVDAALVTLGRRSLIQKQGTRANRSVVFRHALMEQAVYDSLDPAGRKEIHNSICGVLERGIGPRPQDEPELFARQNHRAGLHSAAINYWKAAAHKASRVWAHDVVCRNLENALNLLPFLKDAGQRDREEFDIRQTYALSLAVTTGMASKRMEVNAGRIEQLRQGTGEMGEWPALFQEWGFAWLTGKLDRMVALQGLLQQRMDAMDEDQPERAVLNYLMTTARGLTLFHTGQLNAAVGLLNRALRLREAVLPAFAQSPDKSGLTTPTTYGAFAYAFCGQYGRARRMLDDDLAKFPENSPEHLLVAAIGANAAIVGGDYAFAFELADRATKANAQLLVANARVWAELYRLIARIHLDRERTEKEERDPALQHGLQTVAAHLDVVVGTEIRAGILMQYLLAGQVADRVLKDKKLSAVHESALSLFRKCMQAVDQLLNEPNIIQAHGHIIAAIYDIRARMFEIEGDEASARDRRAQARAAWARLQKVDEVSDE